MIPVRISLLATLLLFLHSAYGQQPGIEFKSGYSTYAMNDLQKLSAYQKSHSNIPLKITADFPPFVTFGTRIFVKFKQVETGIDYTYLSTGGRVHYRDYSGQIGFDQIAVAHAVGIFAGGQFVEHHRFTLKGSLLISLYSSTVNFNQYVNVGNYSESVLLGTISKSVVITPSIEPVFSLTPWMYTGIRIGAGLDTRGGLRLKENHEAKLIDDRKEAITTDWSGFRSELFLGIHLPAK